MTLQHCCEVFFVLFSFNVPPFWYYYYYYLRYYWIYC